MVRRCAEGISEQAVHFAVSERTQADTSGTVLLQEAEQVFRVVLRGTAPGQDPPDRVRVQFRRQCPQSGQRFRPCPLQVIQAHQDRIRRGPLFQVRADVADPPWRRIRRIVVAVGGELGEWLRQGRTQREEGDRPAQLVRCSRRQREAVPAGLVAGLAQQQGLAHARLPLHQHHCAAPFLSAPQQVPDDLLLRRAPPHDLVAGRPESRCGGPAGSRPRVTDRCGHINHRSARHQASYPAG